MRRCTLCVLPETFPNIRFDAEGVCNQCRSFQSRPVTEEARARYRKKFERLVKDARASGAAYDAVMAYSGGKDSTYVLAVLKERYNLRIVSLTLDNGFISRTAFQNIRKVVDRLGIDHLTFKPSAPLLRQIFRITSERNPFPVKTIERASPVCTACIAFVKSACLKTALAQKIPFIVFGWSPGQVPITASIFKNTSSMLHAMQKSLLEPLQQCVGREVIPYFVSGREMTDSSDLPYNVAPLAFLNYREEMIYDTISRLGWQAPTDTDSCSTNCLLNTFAIRVHRKKYGFHPYVFEIAKMVREGVMSRNEGLQRMSTEPDETAYKIIERQLAQSDSGVHYVS